MELIGKGNTAEVYDLGDGKVLKLFVEGYPVKYVEHEFNNAKIFAETGAPVPKAYEMKEVNGRNGIVYEKIEGCSLLEWMRTEGAPDRALVILWTLQKQYLESTSDELVNYKDYIKTIVGDKSPELIQKLEKLPDGNNICHGDFHVLNIIMDKNNNPTIIDFMNVCSGPKNYDIARAYYFIRGQKTMPDNASEEEKKENEMKNIMAKWFLDLYKVKFSDIEPFLEVIEVCRKFEKIS